MLDIITSWAMAGPTLSKCFSAEPDLIHQFMVVCTILGLGNVITSVRWFRAARKLSRSPERWAMSMMFAIFLLTALTCDFLVLVKMYWPIWRLQIYMLWGVAIHTWLFILHPAWFRAIVAHMAETDRIAEGCRSAADDMRLVSQTLKDHYDRERLESV